jgi:phage tail-like protein
MSGEAALLPVNSTAFEKAVVATTGARLNPLPVPLRELWRPKDMPAALLPWLAWGLSVDVWDENWSVEQKRAIVLASFQMHQKKGTLGGITRYVRALGAEMVRAFTPPGKSYLSPSLTREQREAALGDLPQIRLYDWVRGGTSTGTFWHDFSGKFLSDSVKPFLFTVPGTEGGWKAATLPIIVSGVPQYAGPLPTAAGQRLMPAAIYWDRGVATDLTRLRETQDTGGVIDRIYLPPVPRLDAVFSGEPFGLGKFFMPSRAAERMVTLNLLDTPPSNRLVHLFPVVPSFSPVNSAPDHVAEHGFAPASVFSGALPLSLGSFMGHDFFVPSTASRRLYQVVYLRDATRQLQGRKAISFMGDDRFGIERFTAELDISVRSKRPAWAAGEFMGPGMYFLAGDRRPLNRVLDAVVRSKSRRDKIRVNSRTFRPARMGSPLFMGTPIILGSWTRS